MSVERKMEREKWHRQERGSVHVSFEVVSEDG